MMTKQQFLNTWKNVDLNELGLLKAVFFNGLTEEAKQRMMKEYGFIDEEQAADQYFFLDADVEEEDIEDWDKYVEEWSNLRFREEMAYIMGEIFKREYPYFLCHSEKGDWMGNSSYQLYSEKDIIEGDFLSEYDNTTTIIDYYKGKVLELKESHHDVPFGHPVYLVGLTEKQAIQILRWHENGQRMNIKKFVESIIY